MPAVSAIFLLLLHGLESRLISPAVFFLLLKPAFGSRLQIFSWVANKIGGKQESRRPANSTAPYRK
jgi:hypothetical protein